MAAEDLSFRARVLRGFLWLGTGTFVGQFVSWISTILVIRLLSPSDYGLMAMTAVFISLLTMIGEMGISSALIQAKELTDREIGQIFGWVLISGLVGVAVCYALAPWVAHFYAQPELVTLVRVLAVNLILVVLYVVPQSLFVREMNFKIKAQVDIAAQLGTALLTLLLAVKGMGVWALVVGQIAMHAIRAVAFNALRPSWLPPIFAVRGSWRLLKYGLTVTGDRLMNFVYAESDKIIVGKFLGNSLLGIYAVAVTLASIPMEKVLPIITHVSFASYARIQHDMDRIRRNLLRATRAVSFAGFPMFFGMSAVAPLAIPLILGAKWEPVVVPFQLLCLALPFKALSPILSPAVFAIGRPMVNLVNMVMTAGAMAAAFLVGVRAGIIGVCVAWVAVYPVVFGVTTIRSLRTLGIPAAQYVAELRFPLLASASMWGAIKLLGNVIHTPQPLYALVLFTVFGLLFYLSLAVALKREEYAEIRSLLQR